MVQQSIDRLPEKPFDPEAQIAAMEAISADEARKALILQDMLRVHLETYYPEFFVDETELKDLFGGH